MRVAVLSFFPRTPKNAANNAGTESTTSSKKYEGPRTNQPTKVYLQTCLTRNFSTLTRETYYGSSRPDPDETRTSQVTRSSSDRVVSGRVNTLSNLAGRVGSGQEVLKSHGSGRVGSGRVGSSRVKRFRNLAGRVGSGQEVLKSRGSGQVGSGGFQISRVGSSHDPRGMGHYTDRATLTREFLSSDPRVGP